MKHEFEVSAHKAKCVVCGNEFTDYDASPRQWCSVGCQYGGFEYRELCPLRKQTPRKQSQNVLTTSPEQDALGAQPYLLARIRELEAQVAKPNLDVAPDGSWKYQAAYDRGRQDEREAVLWYLRCKLRDDSFVIEDIERGKHLK